MKADIRAAPLLDDARAYFDLARSLLEPGSPSLFAVGGLNGSGKSTLSSGVAPCLGPPPGARVLSSDRIRKQLHGVWAEERLPASAYRAEVSETVYSTMRDRAVATLGAGWTVVVDAVFDRPCERSAFEAIAKTLAVPFSGVWLYAPTPTLLARISGRRNDPSDATANVLQAQFERGPGEITWPRLNAEGGFAQTRDAVLAGAKLEER